MKISRPIFILLLFLSPLASAETPLDCYTYVGCIGKGRSTSISANPSNGNQIRINPSAVPTEKSIGLEGIYFKKDTDLSLVQGLGRVGAAISPSNSEDTFFGPPGFEIDQDTFLRKQNSDKYPSQKVNFAAAFDVIKAKGSGIRSYGLKLGAIAKYNKLTSATHGGGGLSLMVGPLLAGYSVYDDETQLDYTPYGLPDNKPVFKFQVQTYSVGASLSSLLVDYSVMRLEDSETHDVSSVRVATASLLVKRMIFTAAKRIEDSDRLYYNYSTQLLETKREKEDFFGGFQFSVSQNLMVGALYNYYMLHEYSATATLFF